MVRILLQKVINLFTLMHLPLLLLAVVHSNALDLISIVVIAWWWEALVVFIKHRVLQREIISRIKKINHSPSVKIEKSNNYDQHASAQHDGFHANIQIHWEADAKVIGVGEQFSSQTWPLLWNFTNFCAVQRKDL